jgi:glutamine---fructose-6-phosphate transaminase (isomerizing)
MDAGHFAADLEAKPRYLRQLADRLAEHDPWRAVRSAPAYLFLGMGSSHYAGGVAAARLRATGRLAFAELASSDLLPRLDPDAMVVAVSATGESRETLYALDRLAQRHRVVALTNAPDSTLARRADAVVELAAGDERGGVACRTFQHTLALLLALQSLDTATRAVAAAAEASADLLSRRTEWLATLVELLAGPDGTHVVAPARRFSSAQQAALMLREGPRRPAVACETGDWSHVDVYLTRSTDYRMLLFADGTGRWEDELLRWTGERGSTVVAVGADVPGADLVLRYSGDDHDDVRLLSEVLVAELAAAQLWQ